jgi:D-glycero-alpha-D-manno-heptose-7-phosphate kinase
MLDKFPRYVTTITPQRISFAGGGTDFPDFYLRHGGAVVSATINQFAYVTVKRHSNLFQEQYRLSYSKTEHVDDIDLIENDIARECLRFLNVDPPLFISTTSDLPLSSGLGSSSSFAVGLLLALHTLRGETVAAGQLAEEACHIEINVLGKPIGKQDQYAVAFGGLNYYEFRQDGRVRVESLWNSRNDTRSIFDSSILFWTGVQRKAEDILSEQQKNIPERIDSLIEMSKLALRCREVILNSEELVSEIGEIINMSWVHKRNFASTISSDLLDDGVARAIRSGAIGSKIAGAGGGGFLYVLAKKVDQENVVRSLSDMSPVSFDYSPFGARVLISI